MYIELLAWQDSFRTFRWSEVVGDLNCLNTEIKYLLNII
jgi:hypothetical protein